MKRKERKVCVNMLLVAYFIHNGIRCVVMLEEGAVCKAPHATSALAWTHCRMFGNVDWAAGAKVKKRTFWRDVWRRDRKLLELCS